MPRNATGHATRQGRAVKRAREAKGLTQQVLATRAGVGTITISRIENGRHLPRRATLEAIARILDVGVDDLVGKAS